MRRLFTSESVTEGHPDKLCDQISDAVLDAILENDPYARVACETFATTGIITVMGEITTDSYADINAIVRKVVTEVGYDAPEKSFNGNTCAVMTAIHEQSPDIAMGVNDALEIVMRYIDDAIMLGVPSVRILHGKGTGALREEIQKYVRTVPGVSSAQDEHIQLGGSGVTVVKFD